MRGGVVDAAAGYLRAAGIVMDALHTGDAREGMFKAKLLAVCASAAALGASLRNIFSIQFQSRILTTRHPLGRQQRLHSLSARIAT